MHEWGKKQRANANGELAAVAHLGPGHAGRPEHGIFRGEHGFGRDVRQARLETAPDGDRRGG